MACKLQVSAHVMYTMRENERKTKLFELLHWCLEICHGILGKRKTLLCDKSGAISHQSVYQCHDVVCLSAVCEDKLPNLIAKFRILNHPLLPPVHAKAAFHNHSVSVFRAHSSVLTPYAEQSDFTFQTINSQNASVVQSIILVANSWCGVVAFFFGCCVWLVCSSLLFCFIV